MSELKTKFRASYGLDASNEKVINVAKADKTILSDGVNVEFLIQENTVQPYNPSRTYDKGFVVSYNGRLWIAQENVPLSTTGFNESYWKSIRVDPRWLPINSGKYLLQTGDYITVDTSVSNSVEFTLPSNSQEGDTIVVKDIGGQTGYSDVVFKAGLQSIYYRNERLIETKMTVPFSEWVFVYMNKLWNLYNGQPADLARIVTTAAETRIQAGQTIIRRYDRLQPIQLVFPKNAINGDTIHFIGMDVNATPYFNLEIRTFDDKTSLIVPGMKSRSIRKSLSGYFVFDANQSTWLLYDFDSVNRLRTVNSDTLLFPNETVSVVGTNNNTKQTINLTLPTNVENGDQVTVALNYIRKGQTVNIVAGGTDKILSDKNLMQFPKRSSYPPEGNWVNGASVSFNGDTDYPPVATFAYIDMGVIKQWMVVSNMPQLERVDPTNASTRSRLGVIALATQDQANLDKSAISDASKEVAITPETLANRTALENRQGIARISTQSENNYDSNSSSYSDETIVTPKKLDAKQATESMRGLAEIATQAETNAGADDSRIVTPKKLASRYATEGLSGLVYLTQVGAKEGANRTSAGTGVYNFNDHTRVVTPKTLDEWKATEISFGGGFVATESEVIAGADNPNKQAIFVTPGQLHKKTATEGRIGFSQIATQAETNAGTDDFKYITPKKLDGRVATYAMTGLSRYASQAEFDAGFDSLISTPSKIKDRFSQTGRVAVNGDSGLLRSGNIWSTLVLNITDATTTQRGTLKTSTQDLTTAGVDDTTAVTPKTLQGKKSTTAAEGIIRVATTAEVVAGTVPTIAVSPSTLKYVIQTESSWQATTAIRGTVKMTESALTFVGDNVSGNTQSLDTYLKSGYAISPYELNKTLTNFMPLKAKAVDSDLLDGLDSTQFIRRDIDQVSTGNLTLQNKTLNASQLVSENNLQVKNGYIYSNDTNHYIDIGKNQLDRIVLGSYNGAVQVYDTESKITIFDISKGGNVRMLGGLTADYASITGNVQLGSRLIVNGQETLGAYNGEINLGNTNVGLRFRTADAGNINAQDGSGSYKVLTEKNYSTIGANQFIKRAGDTVSGRINFTSPITTTIPQQNAKPNAVLDSGNFGTWVVDITDSSIYNTMKGYLVAIPDTNAETGQPTGFIKDYQEFKGPGTLSQFGSSASNGSGTYQIWAPRPPAENAKKDGHIAGTFYMRSWNTEKGDFDGWGRVFTSNNPPTAGDIGAMANNGSVFDSLRIRDWIQIGHLRIYADPATKSVKFEWID